MVLSKGYQLYKWTNSFTYKQEIYLKRYPAAFQLWNLFLGVYMYILCFVTQGHPTYEIIIDTVTMQAVQKFYYCKCFKTKSGHYFLNTKPQEQSRLM